MTRFIVTKLNHFAISILSGVVMTSEWLQEQGISPKLAWWYVHSGLLERIGMKAYKKAGDNIAWSGAVSALQSQLHLPLHVGGKSALQLLGLSHFVPLHRLGRVMLFAEPTTQLPSWFMKKNLWDVEFEIFKTSLFQDDAHDIGIIERSFNGITLKVSSPERAAMELLYLYPKHQPLDEVFLLIENLDQLRPTVVQLLLEQCKSVKVKRLFLYLAEKYQHPWVSALDIKRINLGHGKRVIGSGGKYDPKYKLSLPEIREEKNEFLPSM